MRCWKPKAPSLTYAFQHSLIIVVPSLMCCRIISSSVALSHLLFGNATRKVCRVSWYIPPNIHCPSINLPRWYFVLSNFDSSISTVTSGPPTGWPVCSFDRLHNSTKNSLQWFLWTWLMRCHYRSHCSPMKYLFHAQFTDTIACERNNKPIANAFGETNCYGQTNFLQFSSAFLQPFL